MEAFLYAAERYRATGKNYMPLPSAGARAVAAVQAELGRRPDSVKVACLCGVSPGRDVVVSLTDRNGLPCRIVLCRSCGLIRIDPQPAPDMLAWFYGTHYRDIYGPEEAGSDALFRSKLWKGELVVDALQASGVAAGAGPVIDIGCGGGWTLKPLAQGTTRALIGYDFDERLLALGRAKGLDLRRGGLDEAERDQLKAGLMICSHVLEHVEDPIAHLARLKALIAADGVLYLEVPHVRRIGARLSGDSLMYWQRAHLWDFQREHLTALLMRAGLSAVWSDEDDDSVFVLAKPMPSGIAAPPLPPLGPRVEAELLAFESLRSGPLQLVDRLVLKPARMLGARVKRWRLRRGRSA